MRLSEITEDILEGKHLTKEDDLSVFLEADINELTEEADWIRKTFLGSETDTCTIISGISGGCSEDCKFCAQSAHSETGCQVHGLLYEDDIVSQAKSDQEEGVARFSIVNSGRAPSAEDFEKLVAVFQRMNQELDISLCASLGFLSEDQWTCLYEAGVKRAHINIETSRNFFPQICTTHTFDDKIRNIYRAKAAGLEICSGGIIGMGESWQDRIDMALTLSEMDVRSIPINILIPVKGTPLEDVPRIDEADILRTIAIFRFICPKAHIRLAGGRALMEDNGRRAFLSGASATITGNMLTTSGSTIKSDLDMLHELGLTT